ncbi:hypothetical protein JHK87_047566 [Glycine soja]|nr:hypothetical protein JHK87_047566 [Glycine soja]
MDKHVCKQWMIDANVFGDLAYRSSMLKVFKHTVEEGVFSFVIEVRLTPPFVDPSSLLRQSLLLGGLNLHSNFEKKHRIFGCDSTKEETSKL